MGPNNRRGALSNGRYQLANILRVDANVSDVFCSNIRDADAELGVRNRASMEVELVRAHVTNTFLFRSACDGRSTEPNGPQSSSRISCAGITL
jgi:hypothetical protein